MKLNIVSCTTGVLRYAWETYVLLNNLRERNLSKNAHILVWIPHSLANKPLCPLWSKMEEDFPEASIEYFVDEDDFERSYSNIGYLPLLRPKMLIDYFKANPHLSNEAILYIDTDILITKDIDWNLYLEDDINYLSDTNSYINATYFDSKSSLEYVCADKWEKFKERDILQECAEFAGITREICVANDAHSGGAQYLMKGIDSQFWEDVLETTINMWMHLRSINEEYMQDKTKDDPVLTKQNVGYQAWCADMWGVLWNLWKRGKVTRTPKDFDFAWATDEIERLEDTFIFHNAGITEDGRIRAHKRSKGGTRYIDAPAFFKGAPIFNTKTPFEFEHDLKIISEHGGSKEYCTSMYAAELLKVKHLFNL